MKLSVESVLSHEETRWSGLRELLLLAFPIIITMGSNTLMNAADTWMVSQLGEDFTAAIAPASLLNAVLVSFFIGVLSCVNTFVGQSYGRGERAHCSHYAWQGIHLSLIIGVAVLALWFATPALFSLTGHTAVVQELESKYFQIRLFGIGGAAMTVCLAAFFQAIGRPAIPMVATLLANVFNLVADYALIFGRLGMPALGISGAAIATNIASWLCALTMLAIFVSKTCDVEFASRKTWRWDWPKAKQLFRIGWPAGVSMGLDVASWTVFITFIVGSFGTEALAAGGITGTILASSFMPTVGLGIALTALVGQWVGRRREDIALARFKTALKLGAAYMAIMGVVFVVFHKELIALFRPEADIVRIGGQFLLLAAFFQLFDAVCIVTSGALRGAGDTRWPMLAGLASAWGIFLPLGYVLAFHTPLGVIGGWIAAIVYIFVFGALLLWRFASGKWKKINIFATSEVSGETPQPLQEIPDIDHDIEDAAIQMPPTGLTGTNDESTTDAH